MNICIILPSIAKKGPNIVAADIINSLVTRKLVTNVDVLYFDEASGPVVDFAVKPKKITFFKKINFSAYDVVHSHMLKPDLYVFIQKIIQFNNCNSKFVTTLHQLDITNLRYDYNSLPKALLYSFIWRFSLSFHDQVICLSKSMESYYKKRLWSKNISYIYNGRDFTLANESTYPLNEKREPDEFRIGTACLLTERKGLEQLIRVLGHFPMIHFYIAGSGPFESELKRIAIEYKVANRVHFLGFIDNSAALLSKMDAFILPSRGEGFPLSLLEAASLGLACICSDLDVIKETFTDDEVVTFTLDDSASLISAIKLCMSNKEKMGLAINNKYQKSYTATHMADSYLATYKKVIKY